VCTSYPRQPGGGYDIVIVLSAVLSFCKQDNWRTRKQTSTKHGSWQARARSYPLEMIKFWWWSGCAYGFRVIFPFSPLRNRRFLDIC